MPVLPHLIPIELNANKRRKINLENIVKMLTNRHVLKHENLETNINKISNLESDDLRYEISLDNPDRYYDPNTKSLFVKIINQKISGVSKTSIIAEFLTQYEKYPKIIIVSEITNKVRDQIMMSYPYTEIFLEKELLINIVDHVSVPKHELLTDDEAKLLLEEYNSKKKDLPKIYVSDAIARYFNAKIGQIFRIIRPSETSGLAPYHRLVVKGNVSG
jgi:DNA-directed RNA polymerase I, II, and III subunit RPABC1